VPLAHAVGADVIDLDLTIPFTAARARNAGFGHLAFKSPHLAYVQFVDGDCELRPGWVEAALTFLEMHPDVAAVCGRRRERFPEQTVYNWLCDREWDGAAGEVRACGGDVLIRCAALAAAGGYREDLIAGEEPELCVRLRQKGYRIWRLAAEMTLHDAAMTSFAQWWRRAVRAGFAYAQGAQLHGAPPERHFVWERRRAWLWGVALPLICLAISLAFIPWGALIWLIYPLQLLRQTLRNRGTLKERATLALFQILARFAEAWGQIKFVRHHVLRRQARLIEYK
jgi:GT2 family glycosyltransferase